MNPIGLMRTPFKFKNGTPRQPTVCSHARGSLTIDKSVFNNPEHSLEGLEDFSHVWILFIFHKNNNAYTKAKVKPPRLNGKKVGLFSTRSPYRPNNIGLSLAKIESVRGATIYVSGIDILDGTPVLDIKPYIPQYDCPSLWVAGESDDPELDADLDDVNEAYGDKERNDESISKPTENFHECKEAKTIKTGEIDDCLHNKTLLDKSEYNNDSNIYESSYRKLKSDNLVGKRNETMKGMIEHVNRKKEPVAGTDPSRDPNVVGVCQNITLSHNDQNRTAYSRGREEEQDPIDYVDENLIQKVKSPSEKYETHKASSIVCDKQETKHPEDTFLESNTLSTKSDVFSHFNTVSEDVLNIDSGVLSQTAKWISNSSVKKLCVRFTPSADQQLKLFSETSQDSLYRLQHLKSSQAREAITSILHEDPRSTYRRKSCVDSLYYFTVDCLHVTCWFDENIVEVVRIKPAALVEYCKSEYL